MINRQRAKPPGKTLGSTYRPDYLLPPAYAAWHQEFRWQVPAHFNMAEACCGRWAYGSTSNQVAVTEYSVEGRKRTYTYRQLQRAANQLSRTLRRHGGLLGDRVAIVLPQCFATAVA